MKKDSILIWTVLFMSLFVLSGCTFLSTNKSYKEIIINRNFEKASAATQQTINQSFIDDLSKMVKNKTISQQQADAVINIFKNQQPVQKALMILVSQGTLTEAQADAVEKIVNTDTKPFARLVKEGVITQAQADAVMKAVGQTDDGKQLQINEAVARLIESGILNQSQADAIIKDFKE